MISTAITAILSFTGTNIDDIFVLLILFSQVNEKIKAKDIIIGQYLGIGFLVTISLLGAFGLQFLSQKYIGILGLIPIALGINAWLSYNKENQTLPSTNKNIEVPIITDHTTLKTRQKEKNIAAKIIKPEILNVTLITIANGADNIGIYMPLFVSYTINQLILAIFIFLIMIAIWCFLGERLANLPIIKNKIQNYKHIIIPVVFIGLGVYIIFESDAIPTFLNIK